MIKIGNAMIYLTDPGREMLLGFAFEQTGIKDENGKDLLRSDILSIGGFFFRIDIFFNNYLNDSLLEKEEDETI